MVLPISVNPLEELAMEALGIPKAEFDALSQMKFLPADASPNLFKRQICYLALMSQGGDRSPLTESQEKTMRDTMEKITVTDRWLHRGPTVVSTVCLNGTVGAAASAASIFCLNAHPVGTSIFVTVAGIINCFVSPIVQQVNWYSTGTAPDISSTAQDDRQDVLKESEGQFEKIASKIIQMKRRKGFKQLVRHIRVETIRDRFLAKLGTVKEGSLRQLELIDNALKFVLDGTAPTDTTMSQEARINRLEHLIKRSK